MTAAGAVDVHAPRVNDRRIDEVTGDAPHLVALVRTGATFVNGRLVERGHARQPGSWGIAHEPSHSASSVSSAVALLFGDQQPGAHGAERVGRLVVGDQPPGEAVS